MEGGATVRYECDAPTILCLLGIIENCLTVALTFIPI